MAELRKGKAMASTTNKKLPQPWHTKSFHQTRFWMIMSLVCYFTVESLLKGKFPSLVGGALFFFFFELVAIASWHDGKPDLQPLLLDGFLESQKQFKKLVWCIASMIGAFGIALYIVFCLVSDYHPHLLLLTTMLVGANLTGYFLLTWLREAFALTREYRIGAVANTHTADMMTPVTSATDTHPVPQTHSQRLLAGSGIRP